mgnify:FL=1
MLRILLNFTLILICSGCGTPLWLSMTHTAADALLVYETGKSSGEHGLSMISGKECKFIRVLDGQSICMSETEYKKYLLSLNCDIYGWDRFGRVSCLKKKD